MMTTEIPAPRQPAEWEPHQAVWTAWPSHAAYWEGHIEAARSDIGAFLRALAQPVHLCPGPERIRLWVDGAEAMESARRALDGCEVELIEQPFGDVWFRDIAPVFVRSAGGALEYRIFKYNGWGGKYVMENDDTVARRIASVTGLPGASSTVIFEGGALDVDGYGLGLTTRSCLLNPNRNPHMSAAQMEAFVREQFGVESLVWLRDGLLNDHTDGHVDNIARFVAPGKVVCQHPAGDDDPNRDVLREIAADLRAFRTPSGKPLEVFEIPSPGKVAAADGGIVPASHMNFYIANHRVLVPCYGTPTQDRALEALQQLFPGREVVGLPSNGVLTGGGSFHCITQQMPLA
jgi:agmatine deiminase